MMDPTERKSITFFRSYYEAACLITDLTERADFYHAIFTYVFTGKEPMYITGTPLAMFKLAKPNIDYTLKKADAGAVGGSKSQANRKQSLSKTEANDKQSGSKPQPIKDKGLRIKDKGNNINNTNVLFVGNDTDLPPETQPKFGKFQPIVDAWNSLPLQNIISLKSTRLKLLEARIKEHGFDEVIHGITMIRNSKFLLGQNNNGWQVTFDWFVKPGNFVKVLEGNYDDNKQGVRMIPQGKNDTLAGYQRMMELLGSDDDNEQN